MKQTMPNIKNIILVGSGKGGVGKSATAMNLAVALSVNGQKVGLLDADIYGPSVPKMLGVTKSAFPVSDDGKNITPAVAHGIKCMSMGFLIEEGEPVVWRGPMLGSALKQMLFQTSWGELDTLVVDLPPGTGDVQISMAGMVDIAGAIIVSTPQDVALLDAQKAITMFKKVNVPILGMVENMSTFMCPECGHESHIFGHNGALKLAEEIGLEVLAQIPLDLGIRLHTDEGKPVVINMANNPQAQIYRDFAEKVAEKLANPPAPEKASDDKVKVVIESA
jgi:ATP-binding protein involved in chromosome partitioning